MEKNMLTPIIIGASGLIGGNLYEFFKKLDPATIGTYNQTPKKHLVKFDLQLSTLNDLSLAANKQYVVIICAAITNISHINENPNSTAEINVMATEKIMRQFRDNNIPIIYVSSDNVFRGDIGQYKDNSALMPISEYGLQKKQIEDALFELTEGDCTIVRLAKVVASPEDKNSILFDIYRQLNNDSVTRAATDLIFNPTYISDIVLMFSELIQNRQCGKFNFCNTESFSRYELTMLIASSLNIESPNVEAVKFSALDSSGRRPLNTTMLNSDIFKSVKFTTISTCIELFKLEWADKLESRLFN